MRQPERALAKLATHCENVACASALLLLWGLLGTSLVQAQSTDDMGVNGFVNLAQEQSLWRAWFDKHNNHKYPIERFFHSDEAARCAKMEKQLVAINRDSHIFVLVLQINDENGKFRFVVLAKAQRWQLWEWAFIGNEGMKERKCIVEAPADCERLLRRLSTAPMDADLSQAAWICDVDSVYVLVRCQRATSRFAVYNPVFRGCDPQNRSALEAVTYLLWNLDAAQDSRPDRAVLQRWFSPNMNKCSQPEK